MWFPAVPSVEEVMVTVLPLALAVLMPRFAAHVPALIAAARLVARVDGVLLVIKVPVKFGAEPVHVVEPLELPLTTPQAELQALIAAARLVATSDGVAPLIKVPLVEPGQVCVPSLAAVGPLHA